MTISKNQRNLLFKAYDEFHDKVRLWFVKLMQSKSEDWEDLFIEKFHPDKKENWLQNRMNGMAPKNLIELKDLRFFFLNNKDLFPEIDRETLNRFPTWLSELQELRNSISHFQDDISEDQILRGFSTMKIFAKKIGEEQLYDKINSISSGTKMSVENQKEMEYGPIIKGKYLPLQKFFNSEKRSRFKLIISEIENILHDKLPPSAFKHPPWWGNDKSMKTHPQKRTWLTNGYKVSDKNLDKENHSGYIEFQKTT